MNFKAFLALAPLVLSAACHPQHPGDRPNGDCVGKCDGASVPSDLAIRCDATNGQVSCVSALAANYPLTAKVSMYTTDGKLHAELTKGETLTAPVGTEVLVSMELHSASPQQGLFSADGDSDAIDLMMQITKLDGARTFAVPYDVWSITVTGDSSVDNANLAAQSFAIAPWQTFLHNASNVTRAGAPLPSIEPGSTTFNMLVAKGATSIAATGEVCSNHGCNQHAAFVFDGPGNYVTDGKMIARATAITPPEGSPDLTPSSPDLTPSTTVTPPTDAPDMTPAPTTSTDPDPSCGADNQASCNNDQTCDDHFVYVSFDGFCHACGNDGQRGCGSNYNTCDDHFVYISFDGKCRPCGTEGLHGCGINISDCDDHFVYISFDAQCHACGTEGLRGCGINYSDCDAPLVYSSWSGTCHTP